MVTAIRGLRGVRLGQRGRLERQLTEESALTLDDSTDSSPQGSALPVIPRDCGLYSTGICLVISVPHPAEEKDIHLTLMLTTAQPTLRVWLPLLRASQDDGEVRAALGTSSQWRGLRPRDALAAISQGPPVIASPDGLQVTPGRPCDGRWTSLVLEKVTPYQNAVAQPFMQI
ncbi:unnamed protein product [Pleuronectes platessa]|uniref:Uncharacterized protein n=1 Tax=Pleuronectes platessa TaxID=8262 RepID=A0A9N7Z9I6_PLEPL|nr:unnamed protein product [Pleuronectes platessa]